MSNIGIVTFSRACNYGAFLQAYALQEILCEDDTIKAYIIDYKVGNIEKRYSPLFWMSTKRNLIKKIIKTLLEYNSILRRNNAFKKSRNSYYNYLTRPIAKQNLLVCEKEYDAYIVGSDQVWNREIIHGDDDFFFLNFTNKLKFSYAASVGNIPRTDEELQKIIQNISRFNGISVRERSFGCLLKKYIPNVVCSLDPVFLLSRERWISFADRINQKPYVLFFSMGQNANVNAAYLFAQKIAKDKGLVLLYLSDNDLWYKYIRAKHFGIATPNEFLGLINEASYVVTNSFHATAFSIIFHKDFYVETEIARNGRILDLLSDYGLEDRALQRGKTKENIRMIDWEKVDYITNKNRDDSKEYLYSIVLKVKESNEHKEVL